MNYRFEIQDILRQKGIDTWEAYKTIFGIASVGVLIGKEKLGAIVNDVVLMKDEKCLEKEILLNVSEGNMDKSNILHLALQLISIATNDRCFAEITEIVLRQDLLDIVQNMNFYDYGASRKNAQFISCIPWINGLVLEILKRHEGKTILNMDCGTGDFMWQVKELGSVEKVVGVTREYSNYIISKIRSYFSGNKMDVYNEELICPIVEKFDMVYNSYPLAYKYDSKSELLKMINSWDFSFEFRKKYSLDLLWIINSLQSIEKDGIVVALVPNGVLINEIDVDIRRYLIENNFMDAIISLPSGILPFAGVATSLVILNKNRCQKETVRMIDATNIYCNQRRYKYFSQENIEHIIEAYVEGKHTEKFKDVKLDEIVKNDFYLSFRRYCTCCSLVNPCTLNEVTEIIFRGYQIMAKELDEISIDGQEDSDYRIINISDIRTEGFVNKNLKPVKIVDTRKFDKYCVKDGDIIITAKNTTLKSAIYRSHGKYKAILTGNLIAIRTNEKMNSYYLKAFLDSEQGTKVLEGIQTGTTIIALNPNMLKVMEVSRLPMEQQSVIANEYKDNLDFIEELFESYNAAINKSHSIYEKRLSKT